MASPRKHRIAVNESAFRALNESLETSVHRGRSHNEFAGFVCECGDADCEVTLRLRLEDYEAVRQDSQLFFVVPGHEVPEAEDVVEQGDGYYVVRKCEEVSDVVERTDPRNAG